MRKAQLLLLIIFWHAPSVAWAEAWSINSQFSHSIATQQLPIFKNGMNQGLVRIPANGFLFRARVYGMNNKGPGLILLHGFPSSSIMWDNLAKSAAAKGYRVVAYDQRGYSPGARPQKRIKYRTSYFVSDVFAVAKATKMERFHVVGHDVGCVVGWGVSAAAPSSIRSLSCLSVSHPATLEQTIRFSPPPYLMLFYLPSPIPEGVLRGKSFKLLRGQYKAMNSAEKEEYQQIFTEPGALRSTINFYREIRSSYKGLREVFDRSIETPTLFIYGEEEQWVTSETLAEQESIVEADYRVIKMPYAGETGHFVLEHNRESVKQEILNHIEKY